MYLFQRIEETFMLYDDSKKKVAEFILQKRSKLTHYSMQEIAEATYTSKPTLVRFAQALGYAGWKEFMKAFVEEAYYQESHFSDIDPNYPFSISDSTKDIITKISDLQVESILDTADLLDTAALEQAAERILNAAHVTLFGISPNNLLGELFRRKMESIGRLVYISAVDESGMLSSSLTADDCAVMISYSGNNENREPMRFIKKLQENQVPMIGITSGGNNYIRENIDCILTISSRERLFSKISGFSTEASILSILNILFSCCFVKNYERNLEYKIKNSKNFEFRRRASLVDMKEEG
ncbi:SIS domain-containing protein [Clostridium sp. MCC353]|uniref:MurR/RpiR family transcriptional regulator n=1 Tax=Clostridium sp. MCC353 TaxID=2592646 RepID=UPI001C025C87|nr:MurR/RpiR family transcriptional regulator [Clostridium sp. MCC353]MBT9777351.1 SIS domain-containing protein [Clostridium sp. MCC353]